MKLFKGSLLLIMCMCLHSCSKESKKISESDLSIIPQPKTLQLNEGQFAFNEETKIIIVDDVQRKISQILEEKFKKAANWNLEITDKVPEKNYIRFTRNDSIEKEGYTLEVNKNNINISASGYSGFLYGIETICQLLPVEIESQNKINDISWEIPNLTIHDSPRFKWRGLMLDVSRHFFSKDYILETIDLLAMHKMNVLQLHLVDDQGWRIEINKYPKLTEIGAFRFDQEDRHWDDRRVTTPKDKATYGGFYTQEDIKEIVSYATSKGIEVIPEIEMPAHVMSAIASYPELSCTETPIGVPSGGVWPITEIYCAGKDTTFEFLENVLLEVMDLFPSKYIHIGGDEATKTNWNTCSHCQKRMKNEGLKDVEELQSYFIRRIEKFMNSHNRKLIGWDEILEGGLAPDATVMSWRGVKGGLAAAESGHDVVMTPGTHCYFDHYQGPYNEEPLAWGGYTPLSKVYEFDPVVESMTAEEAKHVLGGQANLWSEQIKTNSHSQYMIFPRLAAMAEVLWSPKESKNWSNFSSRLTSQFKRYNYLGINYSKSSFLVTADTQIDLDKNLVNVILKNEFPNSDIRYNLNGMKLSESAEKYEQPIQLNKTSTIKAALFRNDQPLDKEFTKIVKFHKAVGKKVVFKEIYNKNYKGAGEFGIVNTIRGTKNFHDGQWQAWLGKDMEVIIDLEKEQPIQKITIGSMENQGPGIYYPLAIDVFVSNDQENFQKVGEIKRAYSKNPNSEIKDFVIDFQQSIARYIKVKVKSLKQAPNGDGVWLFIDEILIE